MRQTTEARPRLSPFPPPGSPDLLSIHAEMVKALDRRDEARLNRSQRIAMAQSLRRMVVQVEPQ